METTKTEILAAFASASTPTLESYEIAELLGFPPSFGRAFFALINEGKIEKIQTHDADGYGKTIYSAR